MNSFNQKLSQVLSTIRRQINSNPLFVTMNDPDFPAMNGIEEDLFLGDCDAAENPEYLESYGIGYVLSVYNGCISRRQESITYKHMDVMDWHKEDLLSYIPEAIEFINKGIESGSKVLVHCMAGVSRSATIVIAYLMNKNKMSFDLTRKLVNSKRSVCPNMGFIRQLKLFEEMEFTLNANNQRFRKYLVEMILNIESFESYPLNKMDRYLKQRDLAEKITRNLDIGRNYLCSNCDYKLFNEIHIIKTDIEDNTETDRNWIYVEPQHWMKELLDPSAHQSDGWVRCPQCTQELVEYQKHFKHFFGHSLHHRDLGSSFRFRIITERAKIETNEVEDKEEDIKTSD